MSKAILLYFVITYFSFPVANGGTFFPLQFRIVCVFMYSLFNYSVTKNSEISQHEKTVKVLVYTLKFLEISCTVVLCTTHFYSSNKCGSSFTMNYTSDSGFRFLCWYDCNSESSSTFITVFQTLLCFRFSGNSKLLHQPYFPITVFCGYMYLLAGLP